MAFVQRVQRLQAVAKSARYLSTSMAGAKQGKVQKAVFISQSNDVFTNLAMEEWLNNNLDATNLNIMLCYKNDPCVVVGKSANPWQDANLADDNIQLARRQINAEGQYYDQGVMNFTFFGQNIPENYNLGLIARALFRKYELTVQQNGNNLSFYDKQVSLTCDKIETPGTKSSYQNCSLFVDIDKKKMDHVVKSDINTAHDTITNLTEIVPRASSNDLLSAIGWEFLRTTPNSLRDGGKDLARQQRGFQMINPTDEWFPGLKAIRDRLVEWEWRFSSTPKFSIFRTFQVPQGLLRNPSDSNELRVKLEVEDGTIANISLVVPPGFLSSGYTGEAQIITNIKGQRFSEETLKKVEHFLGLEQCQNAGEKFVTECVKKAMVI